MLAQEGVGIPTIQAILRHKKTMTTTRDTHRLGHHQERLGRHVRENDTSSGALTYGHLKTVESPYTFDGIEAPAYKITLPF